MSRISSAIGRFARSRRVACVLCAAALGALAATAVGQDATAKVPKWRIDPYTKNKPEALAKAGYVSYGPFPFGQQGTNVIQTTTLDEHLSYAQILWVETAHFRIGTNLPAWPVPLEPEIRAKIRGELTRLAEKIPSIDPKSRILDPWLRLHLFAQRCEDTYAEFMKLAGVKDEDFPKTEADQVIKPGSRGFMGMGPYLGMKQKYLLLLVTKEGTYRDYLKSYVGRDSKFGQRWHFKDVGCLLYAVSTESDEGRLKDDTALHGNVAFDIVQNLLDGFRHYSYDLPVWIREGLGHWFERRVSQRYNSFDQTEGSPADMKKEWKWMPLCRSLVGSGKFAPFAEAYTWRDFGSITFNDHVALWSRIDWMMTLGQERWSNFLFEIKGRVDATGIVDQADLVGATRDALQKCYGFSVLQFDDKWSEWVKATYPAQ